MVDFVCFNLFLTIIFGICEISNIFHSLQKIVFTKVENCKNKPIGDNRYAEEHVEQSDEVDGRSKEDGAFLQILLKNTRLIDERRIVYERPVRAECGKSVTTPKITGIFASSFVR